MPEINAKDLVSNYVDDSPNVQVDEDLLYKWAEDVIIKLIDASIEQWKHRVIILPVDNYSAQLPPDFKRFIEVAYMADRPDTTERWQLTQYVSQNGCDVEVTLKCPECPDSSCKDCQYYFIEVNTDEIWNKAHPEYQYRGMKHYRTDGSVFQSTYHPQFKIMQPSKASFFNYYAPYCAYADAPPGFKIDKRSNKIITSFQSGYVLMAYFGVPLDEYGTPTVPGISEVYDAASAYFDSKLAWIDYRKSKNREDRAFLDMADMRARRALGLAKSKLTKIDIRSFWAEMEKYYFKRLGRDPYAILLK